MYELLILVGVLAILGPLAYTVRGHRIWQICSALTSVKVLWQRKRPPAEVEASQLFRDESLEYRITSGKERGFYSDSHR